MKKLVTICVFLSGLLYAYTGFAAGTSVKEHRHNNGNEFTSHVGLPISEPDIVHTVQFNHLQHNSRQANADVFTSVQYQLDNVIQQLTVYSHVLHVVFSKAYLDHIYPSHNFW